MNNLSVAVLLKKNDSPFPSSCQLPVAPQTRVGPHEPSRPVPEGWSPELPQGLWAGNYSCWEILSPPSGSENSSSQTPPLAPVFFPPLIPAVFWVLGRGSHKFVSHLFSALWQLAGSVLTAALAERSISDRGWRQHGFKHRYLEGSLTCPFCKTVVPGSSPVLRTSTALTFD